MTPEDRSQHIHGLRRLAGIMAANPIVQPDIVVSATVCDSYAELVKLARGIGDEGEPQVEWESRERITWEPQESTFNFVLRCELAPAVVILLMLNREDAAPLPTAEALLAKVVGDAIADDAEFAELAA